MNLYKILAANITSTLREARIRKMSHLSDKQESLGLSFTHEVVPEGASIVQRWETFSNVAFQRMIPREEDMLLNELRGLAEPSFTPLTDPIIEELMYASQEALDNEVLRENWQEALASIVSCIESGHEFGGASFDEFIKNLHKILFKGANQYENSVFAELAGELRDPDERGGEISKQHSILPAFYVEDALKSFYSWYEQNKPHYHPIHLAAQVYRILSSIHPFPNGNNRVARLVMNYILIKHGYAPAILRNDDHTTIYVALDKKNMRDSTTNLEATCIIMQGVNRGNELSDGKLSLYCAVIQGDDERVAAMLAKYPSVDARQALVCETSVRLATPLPIYAVMNAHRKPQEYQAVIERLFTNGADINAANRHGHTAIKEAFKQKNWSLILFLLKRGASFADAPELRKYYYLTYISQVAQRDPGKEAILKFLTLLSVNMSEGSLEPDTEADLLRLSIAENLTKEDIGPDQLDTIFDSPQHLYPYLRGWLSKGNWYAVKHFILTNNRSVPYSKELYKLYLDKALSARQFEVVDCLLKQMPESDYVSFKDLPLLGYICGFRDPADLELVKSLVKIGFDINQELNGTLPLTSALNSDRWEIADYLASCKNISLARQYEELTEEPLGACVQRDIYLYADTLERLEDYENAEQIKEALFCLIAAQLIPLLGEVPNERIFREIAEVICNHAEPGDALELASRYLANTQ
jgi:fido (protein-threonine AMPylation protein)